MRKMKKLAGMMLALVLLCALGVSAFADADTFTISLKSTSSGYTYEVYQIFSGDLSESEGTLTLSNIEWGSSLNTTVQTALENEYSASGASAVAEKITEAGDAQTLAEFLAAYTSGTDAMTSAGTLDDTTRSLTVEAGYYLIINTGIPQGTGTAYSNYIVAVVQNITITPKDNSTPTFDKEVESTTDSAKETTGDYDIGDDVPFTLTATLPSSYSAYSSYKLVFHDTLSDGLSFNSDSVTLKVDGSEIAGTNYAVSSTANSDGTTTIVITVTDLKTIAASATNGSKVVVSYTAHLDSDAEVIEDNAAYLEYSNNPNGDELGKTATDKTYVVTFTLNVNKTDEDDDPLEGAAFTLYKFAGVGTTGADDEGYMEVEVIDTDGTTTFTFDGLAVGDYKLSETATPKGYNTAADLYFTIDAVTSETSTGLTVNSITIKDADGAVISEGDGATFTVDTASKEISTNVVNKKGSTLPSTGGIGTTIFYVVGAILVLGAAVLLITRKRMRRAE